MAAQLPTGTVTFLFTDVEGSTRLWEEHPAAMGRAVVQHDAVVEFLTEQHRGHVVRPRGEGDSRFCVFARATDAVAAGLAIQRALQTEPWPTPTPLRVRMALHTGEADLREGDYYGPAVNRCARLRAVAHGGQTLLSAATGDLVGAGLPAGAALRDLGAHRLRDLGEPERVFQLVHAALPDGFPPLRSLDVLPHNLPLTLTSFVGRAAELAEVKHLLGRSRLVTLTGTGGCGKTRLALQAAAELLDAFADGVRLVELAPLADAELVPSAVLAALGVREAAGRPPLEQLVDHLRPRTVLLVLDNCEHLVGAAARTAEALVGRCPGVRVLATSREVLGVAGELPWRVPSLAAPGPRERPALDELLRYEAVQLFVERARVAAPGFAPSERNAAALAQVCARLDGIPLALELAAAWARVLTVEQIAARLDDRFRLLTGGGRTALRRQQTLKATVDWSHDLLGADERAVLRRLSVFAGGWVLEAAEAVCAGAPAGGHPIAPEEVLDLLTGLVDKSLAVAEGYDEAVRYRLPETLRQYAEEKLLEAGEAAEVRARHRDWYLALAEAAEPRLYGPEQRLWLDRLEREHDNLRAALGWCLGADDAEPGLRLATAVHPLWYFRGHGREGWAWLQRLLALAPGAADDPALRAARARALTSAYGLGQFVGEPAAAAPLIEEAVALARTLGETPVLASALSSLGAERSSQGRHAEARAVLAAALMLARRLGDAPSLALTPFRAAVGAFRAGDLGAARAMLEEALAERRGAGDGVGAARALEWLGNAARAEGAAERARAPYAEALSLYRAAGDRYGIAHALQGLGLVAVERGDATEGDGLLRECLGLQREIGDLPALEATLEGLAGVAALRSRAEGRPAAERALRLAGAANAGREAHPEWGWRRWEERLAERWLAPAFALLGDRDAPAAAAAWAAGRAMTTADAIAFALADDEGERSPPRTSRASSTEKGHP